MAVIYNTSLSSWSSSDVAAVSVVVRPVRGFRAALRSCVCAPRLRTLSHGSDADRSRTWRASLFNQPIEPVSSSVARRGFLCGGGAVRGGVAGQQEFLKGTEYVIDSVSYEGEHKVSLSKRRLTHRRRRPLHTTGSSRSAPPWPHRPATAATARRASTRRRARCFAARSPPGGGDATFCCPARGLWRVCDRDSTRCRSHAARSLGRARRASISRSLRAGGRGVGV